MNSIGFHSQLACIWEATARKPGNVHRYVDFADTGYLDFVTSAAAIAPVFAAASVHSVGHMVHEAMRLTRQAASTNTNLGILLLLAPLAKAATLADIRSGVVRVLSDLTVEDSKGVFAAIRLARPGGLGRVVEQDIHDEPTLPLRRVMALAADRDLIARQYANGYGDVFDEGLPALCRGLDKTKSMEGGIIACHLEWMARHPDSLIARKHGLADAEEAARRARLVLEAGWPHGPQGWNALADLDAWLRTAGHGRNPGTSADLVTACLFIALREGTIRLPPQYPWSAGFPS